MLLGLSDRKSLVELNSRICETAAPWKNTGFLLAFFIFVHAQAAFLSPVYLESHRILQFPVGFSPLPPLPWSQAAMLERVFILFFHDKAP